MANGFLKREGSPAHPAVVVDFGESGVDSSQRGESETISNRESRVTIWRGNLALRDRIASLVAARTGKRDREVCSRAGRKDAPKIAQKTTFFAI